MKLPIVLKTGPPQQTNVSVAQDYRRRQREDHAEEEEVGCMVGQ